jgi:hypothetical protein
MRVLILAVTILALGACANGNNNLAAPTDKPSLDTVVDAVQYAVDTAAKELEGSKVWAATEAEIEHWTKACNAQKTIVERQCEAVLTSAEYLCAASCPSGQCSAAKAERCRRYVASEDRDVTCFLENGTENTTLNADKQAWCKATMECKAAKKTASGPCNALGAIAVPELKKATLNAAVEWTSDKSGKIELFFISLGGERKTTTANNVEIELLPRVRDEVYGLSGGTPPPAKREVSPASIELAGDLSTIIVDAVKSTVREYKPDGITPARAPMAIGTLEVGFSLTIDKSGKLGLEKELGPVSLELGGGAGQKRSNSLTIVYARPE